MVKKLSINVGPHDVYATIDVNVDVDIMSSTPHGAFQG